MDSLIGRLTRYFGRGNPSDYRAYSKSFDVVAHWSELDKVLGARSDEEKAAMDETWRVFSGALQGWRTSASLNALAAAERLRAKIGAAEFSNTTVTLMVDQSGSMRGQSMILAAAAIDVCADFLIHLGISVEVLGFTTVSWRGGKSREKWIAAGKPKSPGRLCDLLHVIYREAKDTRPGIGESAYRSMLRPDLLKENVDGESIEWALSRIRARPEANKFLLVISDGAPVDDSTLSENFETVLHDHLNKVIGETTSAGDVVLAALGIGFEVDRYYSKSIVIKMPSDLGESLVGLAERTILDKLGVRE